MRRAGSDVFNGVNVGEEVHNVQKTTSFAEVSEAADRLPVLAQNTHPSKDQPFKSE
jgi:hypothetical protein